MIASDLGRELPACVFWCYRHCAMSVEQGAATQLCAALAPECGAVTGRYYEKSRESRPTAAALDAALAARLWAESERLVAQYGTGTGAAAYVPPAAS